MRLHTGNRVETRNARSGNRHDDEGRRRRRRKFLGWWRNIIGAIVVTLALVALVWCTQLVLDNFKTTTTCDKACEEEGVATATDSSSVSASSVVAVMTPVIAGIVGISGLFFGLSATGSARGKQAEAQQEVAKSNAQAQVALSESVQALSGSQVPVQGQSSAGVPSGQGPPGAGPPTEPVTPGEQPGGEAI